MKICFIDYTKFQYSFNDKDNPLLRGAETTLINLSYNLSLLNNEVYIFNNCSKKLHLKRLPSIKFTYDETAVSSERIEKLIKSVTKNK